MKFIYLTTCLLVGSLLLTQWLVPDFLAANRNRVIPQSHSQISGQAEMLHRSSTIVDWHADTLLWQRDLLQVGKYGHVDLPRLQRGNVALQMFTVVSKTPYGMNYLSNSGDIDTITALVALQGWPLDTWGSLLRRALYQSEKLQTAVDNSGGQLRWIRNRSELDNLVNLQAATAPGTRPVGALFGAEGAHILEGKLENIAILHSAGLRMMGLLHFFDNELGGSLHGTGKQGLTEFGREVVAELERRQIIIDLAHASEQVVREVLGMATRPVVISHTGLRGACDSPRNIADELMQQVAAQGGLIAIGYWDGAICDISPAGIAKSIHYGVNLVGEDHLALGSDFDGSTTTAFDTAQLVQLVQALLDEGLTEEQIRKIMGGNSLRFLQENLPAE